MYTFRTLLHLRPFITFRPSTRLYSAVRGIILGVKFPQFSEF